MLKKEKEIKLIFGVITFLFFLFLVVPSAYLIHQSLQGTNGITLEHYTKIVGDKNFLRAFSNSFVVSSVSALITVLLATFLAYTVHYTNLPKWVKNVISIVSVVPMLLPTMTYGFAIIYSFGKQGLLTKLLGKQFFEIYGFSGLVMGYVIYTLPIAFLLISNTLRYVDKKFITVSKLMGDNSLRTLFTTMIRPIIGTLGAAFVQSFFLSFTDFGIPSSVGGEYDVVATTLYNTMLGSIPDFGGGAVVAITMIIPSVISIALLHFLEKYNFRYDKISEVSMNKNVARDGIFGGLSIVICLSMLSIFAVILFVPFMEMWPYKMNFTMKHVMDVFLNPQLFMIYKNSLVVAFFTSLCGTMIAYGAALVTTRSGLSAKCKGVIDSTSLVINTVPGMVLGIAFLFAFSGTSLQNTIFLLVACNIVHFFSTPYLMMKNSLSKMNESWETTALLMGDTWIKTILRVVTPNAKDTIWEVFGYYFVNSMVTISAVIFLAGAKTMIITTKMKELQYMAKFDQIFAFSILILVTNLTIKGLVKLLTNSKKR